MMNDTKVGFLIARSGDVKDRNTYYRVYYTGENKTQDITGNMIISLIASNCLTLKNAEYDAKATSANNIKGALVGTNGSLTRLPDVNKGEKGVTVIQEYTDGTRTVGYLVCSERGGIKKFKQETLIGLAQQYAGAFKRNNKDYAPITNGKIITKDGKQIVSSIKGEYDKSVVKPKKATSTAKTAQEPATSKNTEGVKSVDLKLIIKGISKAGKEQIKNYQSSMDLALIYLATNRDVLEAIQEVLSADGSSIKTAEDVAERVLRKRGRLAFRTKAGNNLDLSSQFAQWRTTRSSVA